MITYGLLDLSRRCHPSGRRPLSLVLSECTDEKQSLRTPELSFGGFVYG